jgi:predicted transcriptional regulator
MGIYLTKKLTSLGGKDMEKKVLNAMKKAGKPLKTGEIAKMINADSKGVSKAMDSLKKAGKISSPKRCFWEPS